MSTSYFCTFLKGDVVKSTLMSWLPRSKEPQYFSLLLGNLCTTFSIHPLHQSSVRQEGAKGQTVKWPQSGGDPYCPWTDPSDYFPCWHHWVLQSLQLSEALTPWHALRNRDQSVKGRIGQAQKPAKWLQHYISDQLWSIFSFVCVHTVCPK